MLTNVFCCLQMLSILVCVYHVQTLSIEGLNSNNNKLEKKIIYLNEHSTQTIRLNSVLSSVEETASKKQPIFWMFKRIYSIPKYPDSSASSIESDIEVAQTETMISVDLDVESNLKNKYSMHGANVSNKNLPELKYDLVIHNLTYADSGLYICNQWNLKTIYYQLIVASPVQEPRITIESTGKSDLIHESSNVTIKCLTKQAYPYPSIKWLMDNKEM